MAGVADILILVFVVVTSSTTLINAQRGTRPGSRLYYAEVIPDSQPDWETRLISNLMRDYHPSVAPTHNGPVQVRMGFGLTYFDFLNEPEQLAIAHGWSYRSWLDPRLTWNVTEYNGTRRVVLDRSAIWVPDIEISNSAKVTETVDTQVMIYSDGRVRMYFNFQIEFICDMDLKYFPYDTQECYIKFSSFHYTSQYLNLTASTYTNVSRVRSAKDFQIQNFTVERTEWAARWIKPYAFIFITYTVSLSRSSGAYSAKLVLPSVLTGFLILATFLLPSHSYEKITLCGTLFLCLLVLMAFYHLAVPSTGNTILGQYLAFALCIDFFATIMAVISYYVKLNGGGSSAQNQFNHIMLHEGGGGEAGESDAKNQVPPSRRFAWLQYLDMICFVLFSLVFIVGLAVILGRR